MVEEPSRPASGVIGEAIEAGSRVAITLPAQFLSLLVINTIFILGLIWFLDRQNQARTELYGPILTACMRDVERK